MPQITVRDRTIGYEVRPLDWDKSALTLLTIHGSGGDKGDWKGQLDGLSESYTVMALDLPGHGDSEGPGEQTVAAYAQWVTDFVEALGLEQVMVIGCSLGSAIGQLMALRPAPWLRAIGLVGSGARLKVHPSFLTGFLQDSRKAIDMLLEYSLWPGTGDPLRETVRKNFLACPVDLLRGDFSACNDFDIMDRVGEITIPTWIAVGEQDRLTPVKYSTYLNQEIRGSKVDTIADAGHLVMMEKPMEFNSLLKDFLAGLR
jgi:pimeloyl-ACP methyl ester carboxylesterase